MERYFQARKAFERLFKLYGHRFAIVGRRNLLSALFRIERDPAKCRRLIPQAVGVHHEQVNVGIHDACRQSIQY